MSLVLDVIDNRRSISKSYKFDWIELKPRGCEIIRLRPVTKEYYQSGAMEA